MTRDGYRPPDLIPPGVRARAMVALELLAAACALVAIAAGAVLLLR